MKGPMNAAGLLFVLVAVSLFTAAHVTAGEPDVLPAPNGIQIPEGYSNWPVLAVSHRTDNNTLRVILGNPDAVRVARKGLTGPWPDGTILAKLVWKDTTHEAWPAATVPGNFVHAEFMIKNSSEYEETGGWGFARWLGMEQTPYGTGPEFVKECYGCHLPVKANDYVFTRPAAMP